jgi:hypothetical protein
MVIVSRSACAPTTRGAQSLSSPRPPVPRMRAAAVRVSLEPSPENFELLSKNTRAYPNISRLSKALGTSSSSISRGSERQLFEGGSPPWMGGFA